MPWLDAIMNAESFRLNGFEAYVEPYTEDTNELSEKSPEEIQET